MKSQELLTDYGNRIVIRPTRSRLIITIISTLHAGALFLLFFTALDFWILITLAGLILFNLQRTFIFLNLRHYSLSLQLGETLLLQRNNDAWNEIDVIESFVTNWLIVLRVRTLGDSKLHALVYAVDSMNRYSFRQLRIYLNHFNVSSLTKK